jgi:hypothetical protein
MGKRGPQPIDIERLKNTAKGWATVLFGLRDGAKGVAEKWGQGLVISIVAAKNRRKTEKLLEDLKKRGYRIGWPVYSSPRIWTDLKHAVSIRQASGAIRALRRWRRVELPNVGKDNVLLMLQHNPRIFLRAKVLPNYPRRPESNDDKRVIFFAKVLAGLEMDRTPLYTTKTLSGWRCKNYWSDVSIDYVRSFERDKLHR